MKIAFCPYKSFDLVGCAYWLTEKAREGLYMKYFYWPMVFFTEDTPSAVRYHIEPSADTRSSDIDLTRDELFASCGWEYQCSMDYGKLYRTADPAATEPYTDPESRAQSLQGMEKGFKASLIISLVYILLVCAALVLSFTVEEAVLLDYACFFGMCAFWLVWSGIRNISAWRLFKNIRRQLLDTDSAPPSTPANPLWDVCYQLFSAAAFCLLIVMYFAK